MNVKKHEMGLKEVLLVLGFDNQVSWALASQMQFNDNINTSKYFWHTDNYFYFPNHTGMEEIMKQNVFNCILFCFFFVSFFFLTFYCYLQSSSTICTK